MRRAEWPALATFIASSSGIRAAWTTKVGRPTRTPRLVVRWKSLELRILNDRGNTAVDRPVRRTVGRGPCDAVPKLCYGRRGSASADGNHGYGCDADCSAGTCACSRESSQTFGVVNNSGTVLTRHASQAGRAGGSGRYGSDLLTVRGTAKPVKPLRFGPTRFGANAVWGHASGADAILVADDLGDWGMSPASANIARRRGEVKRADTLSVRKQKPPRRLQKRYERADNKLAVNVQRTRRPGSRISQTRLHGDSAIASVAVRLSVFTQLPRPATFTRQPRCRRTVVSGSARRRIYAHSVDICVEAAEAVIPRAPSSQCEGADKSRFLLRVSGSRSDTRRLRSHQ